MLDIVLFVLTSPLADLPISPSINQVKSVAISNIDGSTPNHLLQQVYGTKVLDEDVDVELGDEELELIAGRPRYITSYNSDIILYNYKIMSYGEFAQFARGHDDHQEIAFIERRLKDSGIPISWQAAAVIWNNLRATAPIIQKRAHRGFRVDLHTGQLSYIR
ncbi:hypothetical protein NIES4072_08140 [Nostoc commune NIES-4072]|uniref:Uncharacterized protein n=1 Tax=Nostoc commune NIES-4072 TaxID=2005467 RepID=A0A2R5FGC5_NOSCO|nr:hypothetical protein [Nostoc commune]BBD65511.1 hypothetical protein NIES4070_18690 [Nostoc commune HK-02]GBG17165.1 hypothetical protein NIES4072_08140 [Nostoc commune NIES-4072]